MVQAQKVGFYRTHKEACHQRRARRSWRMSAPLVIVESVYTSRRAQYVGLKYVLLSSKRSPRSKRLLNCTRPALRNVSR